MDMSLFQHARRRGPSPELVQLLARIATEQASSVTSCTVTAASTESKNHGYTPEVQVLLSRRPIRQHGASSFNTHVAERLLTCGQPT
jgi:hypothetical protein